RPEPKLSDEDSRNPTHTNRRAQRGAAAGSAHPRDDAMERRSHLCRQTRRPSQARASVLRGRSLRRRTVTSRGNRRATWTRAVSPTWNRPRRRRPRVGRMTYYGFLWRLRSSAGSLAVVAPEVHDRLAKTAQLFHPSSRVETESGDLMVSFFARAVDARSAISL